MGGAQTEETEISYISVRAHGYAAEPLLPPGRARQTSVLGLLHPLPPAGLNRVVPARLGAGRPLAPTAHLTVDG